MEPLGLTSDQIISHRVSKDKLDGSTWHFFQCKSWIDLAKRSQSPSLIHYTAFELRYGIEYLLFEILVLSSESLTSEEYDKCIGDPNKIKKMIGKYGTNYQRLAEFSEVIVRLTNPTFRFHIWDVNMLFQSWGIASSYLHFVGIHSSTYLDDAWLIKALSHLEDAVKPIWQALTEKSGMGIMRPSGMVPIVRNSWEEYQSGLLSREDLIIRLKISFPTGWISGSQISGI